MRRVAAATVVYFTVPDMKKYTRAAEPAKVTG